MNELVKLGRKRTILISISILLVSIHTIYFYHAIRPEIENKKLIQQLIRFALTIGLLIVIFKGRKWGRILGLILFSLAALVALIALATIKSSLESKIPLFVMVFIYSLAINHFGFSKSFKAFYDYQNSK